MGWRNIGSIERVDQGGYRVCALGKSERQHDSFLRDTNANFTLAECLRLLILVRVLLKCSFWDASALTSCCSRSRRGSDEFCCSFTSQAPWMLMEGLGWDYTGLVQQPLGYHSDHGMWMCWSEEIHFMRWLLKCGAKTNHFFMLMTNSSCLQLLSSPSSPSTIRPRSFVVSSVFVF